MARNEPAGRAAAGLGSADAAGLEGRLGCSFCSDSGHPLTLPVTQLTFNLLYRLAGKVEWKGGMYVADPRHAMECRDLDIRWRLPAGDEVPL